MAILDKNGVPILALGEESLAEVREAHEAYLESGDESHLYVGTTVLMDNQRPVGSPSTPDVTRVVIGGETLDEALKSCVGLFDGAHAHQAPRWIASSDQRFAELLAEHYGCRVKEFERAVKA